MYMKTDILLLADIFEQFCKNCLDHYGLNANDYVSAASLSWAGMLKYTCVMLELLAEVDFLSFCELGVRSGVSQCSNRFCEANNPYMENFDSSKDTSYLL